MNLGNPISTPTSLVERVKAILLKPKEEWPKIDAEPVTVSGLFTSYVMILAAIPALAHLIGSVAFGYSFFGVTWRPSIGSAISMAIIQYILALVGVFVLALIIDWLAPTFGGIKNNVQAFKVAAYSGTAMWVAGIFAIIPQLNVLSILGLYGLYLLYLGLPVLMKAPDDKAMSYTIVTVLAAIVIFFVLGALSTPIAGLFGSSVTPNMSEISGKMNVPGIGSVDLGKMEAASKQMEATAKKMEAAAANGTSVAVAPSALQALLPETVGNYHRTEVESQSMDAGGVGGSRAEAKYESGENHFDIEVTDMAAVGALTAMGAAMNVQSNRQTATGYEKTETVDGRIVTEEWDSSDGDGSYSTTIANRFMVKAEGKVASINDLKAAVAAIGPDKLAAMVN
jgi:hypothetical protein